jgi:hypothetical protein
LVTGAGPLEAPERAGAEPESRQQQQFRLGRGTRMTNQEGSTTMQTHLRAAVITGFAAALSIAGSAQAAFIAGWDFSQYAGAGTLQISEDTNTGDPINSNTLKSNYSDFDTTFGAGGDSQDYGTMYINGDHGSTDVDENAGLPIFRTTTGSLTNNVTLPGSNEVPVGDVNFNATNTPLQVGAGNYLAGTGQDYNVTLSMISSSVVNAVFEANLSALGPLEVGENWSISFAGRVNTDTSNVTIEFSSDGITYSPLTSALFDMNDTLYTRSVAGNLGDNGFFRLGFSGSASVLPRIDNVTISADVSQIPEPGTALLLALGLTGLGVASRRRV